MVVMQPPDHPSTVSSWLLMALPARKDRRDHRRPIGSSGPAAGNKNTPALPLEQQH
jgi:hypothetical protein